MLATGFSSLSQIQKNARGTVDALARLEGSADQPKQPSILLGPVRDRMREPRVVTARSDAEHLTHHLHAVVVPIRLDEFVLRPNSLCARLSGHRHPLFYSRLATVHEILGTPFVGR